MIQTIYSVDEEGIETLYKKVTFNEHNKIELSIDYSAKPHIELRYAHNEKQQMIEEVELSDGVEINHMQYDYNDEGEICEQRWFIGGTVYEVMKLEPTETGFTRTTTQDGEVVEQMVSIGDKDKWRSEFHQNGTLIQVMEYSRDHAGGSAEKIVEDIEFGFKQRHEYTHDKDRLVKELVYGDKGDLAIQTIFEFDGDDLQKETHQDFRTGSNYYLKTTRDTRGNIVKIEERTLTDVLLAVNTSKYDNRNRVIEEMGLRNDSDGGWGTNSPINNYHHIFKYKN